MTAKKKLYHAQVVHSKEELFDAYAEGAVEILRGLIESPDGRNQKFVVQITDPSGDAIVLTGEISTVDEITFNQIADELGDGSVPMEDANETEDYYVEYASRL